MAKQEKWQNEIPTEVYPLVEDIENVTLKDVIEQCDWILEQSSDDTWYGDVSEDEGETFYIADIFVHGYVDQEDGTTEIESRSFEIGYSSDFADAETMAKKGHETIAKLFEAANFELNEEIEYTDY